jgi:hypothetical protein
MVLLTKRFGMIKTSLEVIIALLLLLPTLVIEMTLLFESGFIGHQRPYF